MSLSEFILYPLTHRVVSEVALGIYATAMSALAAYAQAEHDAPVKANKRVRRASKGR
jgi:hypothetical protein